jgi:hypothetical protein
MAAGEYLTTWRQVYCNKRYFYLEAQSYLIDGHPELFLWLWFLGTVINSLFTSSGSGF